MKARTQIPTQITPQTRASQTEPTLICPACRTPISIADALAKATAEQQEEARRAEALRQQREEKLDAEREAEWRAREAKLKTAHGQALDALRKEQEKALSAVVFQQMALLEHGKAQNEAQVTLLREQVKRAEAASQRQFEAGQRQGRTEAEQALKTLTAAREESARLKRDMADVQARLGAASFDRKAVFEEGRKAALEAAGKQVAEFQACLDDLRAQALKREREQDAALARARKEAAKTQAEVVREALEGAREQVLADVARERAVERQRLETQIGRLKGEIEQLHRRAEAGPSEVVGDAAEDVLERELRDAFQAEGDAISRARKGQKAADLTLAIARAAGRTLLVESKWTQAWDSGWVAKAKEDRARAGAEAVVIVSRVLPGGVAHLAQVEDVWVASPAAALALVMALRQGLIAVERARRAAGMDEARVQELKAYLSGPAFREQVEQIVGLAADLDKNLARERTQHERAWKEAHAAFDRILRAAVGIWTDLELASGQGLQASPVIDPFLRPEVETPKRKPRRAA